MQVCNHGNGLLFTGYYSWRVIASSLAWRSAWPITFFFLYCKKAISSGIPKLGEHLRAQTYVLFALKKHLSMVLVFRSL